MLAKQVFLLLETFDQPFFSFFFFKCFFIIILFLYWRYIVTFVKVLKMYHS
jgi:hypothetical protein